MELVILVAIFSMIGFSEPLFAYVDPGSGSLIIQTIVAALLGTLYYFRSAVSRLAVLLRRVMTGRAGSKKLE